jgi:enoyl-CoA hydratase/carnithine racemase
MPDQPSQPPSDRFKAEMPHIPGVEPSKPKSRGLGGPLLVSAGLIAVCVSDGEVLQTALDICRELAAGSATAIHFTKHALNNWLRLAGPSFDASLALEFMGFRLSDVREGLDAVRTKRAPLFKGPAA